MAAGKNATEKRWREQREKKKETIDTSIEIKQKTAAYLKREHSETSETKP